ncbi:autotransporter domain-containing protein [Orrella sp. JC864]|uniref:autotransporter outer membrane beta-barrel domain-containing protein n=1 Tax=Orrella sp. JC864 TaxID=3120298 RepID=UPI003009E6B4
MVEARRLCKQNRTCPSRPAPRRRAGPPHVAVLAAAVAAALHALAAAPAHAAPACSGPSVSIGFAQSEGCVLAEDGQALTVTEGGSILATSSRAVWITGAGVSVLNHGKLDMVSDMLSYFTFDNYGLDASLTNTGTIEGSIAVYNGFDATMTQLVNSGLIQASGTAVSNRGTIGEIVNTGIIRAGGPTMSAIHNFGTITRGITNFGLIEGRVILGSATLYIEGEKARLIGPVTGGMDSAVVINGRFATEGDFSVDYFSVADGAHMTVRNHGFKMGEGAFQNRGTVAIGAGDTATIMGDYIQSAGATLAIATSGATQHGKLVVEGHASFEDGTKLLVSVNEGNTLANGAVMKSVITAGSLEAGSETFIVGDDSELFNFEATVTGKNTVDLRTVLDGRPGEGDGDGSGGSPGGGKEPAGGAVSSRVIAQGFGQGLGGARVLDGFVAGSGNTGDMAEVVTALGRLGSQREVADAVAQTLPLMSASLNQVTLGSMHAVSRVIQARQNGVAGFSGMSSGEGFLADRHLWFKPLASYAEQDDRGGIAGYRASTYGFVFGGDAEVGRASRLGVAFSYARSDVSGRSTASASKADVDAYQLMAYGSHDIAAWPQVEVNWQADVGINRNDGQRTIRFGGLDRRAESDFDSTTVHLGAGIGRGFQLGDRTRFTPSLRTDYYRIRNESYTEKGAGDLNLKVRSQTSEQWFAMLEGRLQHQLGDRAAIGANVGVAYEMLGEDNGITASYVGGGAAFRTPGMQPGRWLGRAGLGLALRATERTEVTARYDVEGRSGFVAQTASVHVRWAF